MRSHFKTQRDRSTSPVFWKKAVRALARFVTREAIAFLLNLKPHEIYRIDCWQHVIHVVAKGASSF
jgi:hypothetical protein